ncbi:MAG: apolipoprotein N-acyltransferase [Treponema sp.]|nr:apolipoprotein N-acyltransferase [Treponema sp.]
MNNNSRVKQILIRFGLVILASVLFALSFPNPVFRNGVPFFAWFALLPILIVIRKDNLLQCAAWGALYGFSSYALFNYWLGTFHPLAGVIAYTLFLFYMAAVFVLLKIAIIFFPKRGFIVQWLIWIAYEYLRTKGFTGYSYGVIGYSQWRIIPLIQIASVTGVWGVSAIVTFPSFCLASITKNYKKEFLPLLIWLVILIGVFIFGFINMKDYSSYPSANIALIQHNTDPWEASRSPLAWQVTESYRKDLNNLIRLSDKALASEPKPQMVVWPETAFIPRIYWHTTYRDDQNSWALVRDLLEYLSNQDVPFLIGNDDARRDSALNPNAAERHRVDYNAAMLFENGVNTSTYRKLHLVPFTEHFPYQKQFPGFYKWLKEADTHFWEKGTEETIFNGPGFTFASPICFEDTFGYISRNFTRKGADVLINLSNDAWSNSLSAQYQHLTMAVFRAVENNRPLVRSTTSGQTCAIDPNGRVIYHAPPFTETNLNVKIPLIKNITVYTKNGDYFGIFLTIAAFVMLLFGALWCTMRKLRSRGSNEHPEKNINRR